MPDLEKVIKGLECCTADLMEYQRDHFCDMCPYKSTNPQITFCFNKIDLMRDALELLKEREAQPAIIEGSDVICIGRCPSCKTVLQPRRANYCYNCGQAVKWE